MKWKLVLIITGIGLFLILGGLFFMNNSQFIADFLSDVKEVGVVSYALVLGVNSGFVETAPIDDPEGSLSVMMATGTYAYHRAIKVTTTDAVTITAMGWYCNNATEEANFEVGIYSHNDVNDLPKDLLYSNVTNAKGTDAGWKKRNGLSWDLNASTIYWLAIELDKTATRTDIDRQAITGERIATITQSGAATLTNPWSGTGYFTNTMIAIYAVYEISEEENCWSYDPATKMLSIPTGCLYQAGT